MVRDYLYIGETSRTLGIRSSQHFNDYRKCVGTIPDNDDIVSSFMWDHQVSHHDGNLDIDPTADYNFDIIDTHQDPLSRQISESVRIREAIANGVHYHKDKQYKISSLNRKFEYFQARKRSIEDDLN